MLRDGGHQPPTGWAPPIRARVNARLVRWAQTVEINTNSCQQNISGGAAKTLHLAFLWLLQCGFVLLVSGWRFTLLESMKKRCTFLEHAIEAMGLSNVDVVCDRAEVGWL